MKGLIKQAQRLFSSKKNGGKLVYKLTDRLHCYKQNLIFLSIALLLGYSQFRTHFECTTTNPYLSKKDVTSFCWINGTYTLNLKKGYHGSEENNPSLRMVGMRQPLLQRMGLVDKKRNSNVLVVGADF